MIAVFALLLTLLQTQAPLHDEPLTMPHVTYPEEARKARIQGTVQLQVDVDATGHVSSVEALSGPVPLRQAAIDAYRQATYRPIVVGGKVAPAIVTTSVNFTLNELPPSTDQAVEAQFNPLQATCQQQSNARAPEALASCRKALQMAGNFSPKFDLAPHATAYNDVVLLLIADGKKSKDLPEAGVLADRAVELVVNDSPHTPAIAVAYITRAEVRSLAGDLRGSAADCGTAEETLMTLLHDAPENERAGNYRVQLRETYLLHAVVLERDHHPFEAKRYRDRAAKI